MTCHSCTLTGTTVCLFSKVKKQVTLWSVNGVPYCPLLVLVTFIHINEGMSSTYCDTILFVINLEKIITTKLIKDLDFLQFCNIEEGCP